MKFGRVEYAPWSIEGPVLLELKWIYLTFNPSLSSQLITKFPTKADTTELVEEKETPTTKYSRPKKRKPNNHQAVEDTSEEEAGAL